MTEVTQSDRTADLEHETSSLTNTRNLREEMAHLYKDRCAAFEERARIAINEVRKREEAEKRRQILLLQKQHARLERYNAERRARTIYLNRSDRYPHGSRLRKDPTETSRYKTYKDGKQVLIKPNASLTPCGEEQNGFTFVQTLDRQKGWLRTTAISRFDKEG